MFDTFLGLPLHPLIVHAVVVLLPLAVIGVILMAIKPAWRKTFGIPVFVILLLGTISAFVSRWAGAALAARVGNVPAKHASYGWYTSYTALALTIVVGAWLLWARRATEEQRTLVTAVGGLASLLGIVVIVFTALTGHSGASVAWSHVTGPAPSPSASAAPSASPSATASEKASGEKYTMEQVAQHNTAESCWVAIKDNVYDLTDWVANHPGGEAPIKGICGSDATEKFAGKHGDAQKPNAALQRHLLGPLSK